MKVACAYIRVSTDMQTEYSPASQLRLIKDYAQKNNIFLNEQLIYKDEGVSGRKAEKRPAFNKMLQDAKLNLFEVILIYNTSRFARNHEESIIYRAMLKRESIEVISITQPNVDPKTDLLMNALYAVMDERYSIELSENVKRGMVEKVKRGKYISCPPFGYIRKEKNKPIEINEKEAKIILYLFNEYINTNKSMFYLAKELNCLNIYTKKGNNFDRRAIYNILKNPTYKGYVKFNCNDEIICIKADHEPIIDEKVFEKVQKKIYKNITQKNKVQRNSVSCNHWLVGVLRCKNCNNTFVFNKGYANRSARFRCGGYCRGICNNKKSIRVNDIENIILNYLVSLKIDTLYFIKKQNICLDLNKEIKTSIKKLENTLSKSRNLYLQGIDTIEQYKIIKEETLHKIDILKNKTLMTQENKKEEQTTLLKFLKSDIETVIKNQFIRNFINKIYIDFDKNEIDIFYTINN